MEDKCRMNEDRRMIKIMKVWRLSWANGQGIRETKVTVKIERRYRKKLRGKKLMMSGMVMWLRLKGLRIQDGTINKQQHHKLRQKVRQLSGS